MTLAARGISASIGPRAAGYPSLDFVAGIGVLVSPEDEELARNILSGIGLEADSPEAGGRLLAPEASHFFAARVVLMQHH